MTVTAILWRRLDQPGHDAARIEEHDGGSRLEPEPAYALPSMWTTAL